MVRARMTLDGMTWDDLARLAGLKACTVQQIVSGGNRSGITRRKLEAALGRPIWSGAREFAERLPMIRFYGGDVETMKRGELLTLVHKHIPGRFPPWWRPAYSSTLFYLDLLTRHFERQGRANAPAQATTREAAAR